jgi:hypothetical protein
MMRFLMGWFWRVLVVPVVPMVLLAAFVVLYAGDWAVFKLRGSPRSMVTVHRYVTIPLKGNKQEFDYLGSIDVPCSVSLFPQAGFDPCWQLRRNPNQGMNM